MSTTVIRPPSLASPKPGAGGLVAPKLSAGGLVAPKPGAGGLVAPKLSAGGLVAPKLSAGGSGLILPGNRPEDQVAFEHSVVDFFVDAADLLGVPKSVAAIYGVVFASPVPLSFAGIDARLDISKGSISQGLRVLREVGALKEVSCAADRAELFTPDLEMRKLVGRFLENRLQRQLTTGKSRLAGLNRSIPALPGPDAETLRQRLKQLQSWHDKARALLPIARTFLKLTPG